MKKFTLALLTLGMSMAFVACDDSDSGDSTSKKTIEDCYPAIYTQAKGLNTAMTASLKQQL